MMQKQFYDLLKDMFGQANVLTVPVVFLKKFNGEHDTALFLSQLIYWSGRSTNREGWVFKTYKDWENEIFVKERRTREIKKRLEQIGLIETIIKRKNGSPVCHYCVNFENLCAFITDSSEMDTAKDEKVQESTEDPQDDNAGHTDAEKTAPPYKNGGFHTANSAESILQNSPILLRTETTAEITAEITHIWRSALPHRPICQNNRLAKNKKYR